MVQLGDETVAFHVATASTHVLDEDTLRLVDTLRHRDGDVSSTDLWREAFGIDPSPSDCKVLNASLEALLHAGLVAASLS